MLLINAYSIMKYLIFQKLRENIFAGSCVTLTSAGSTTVCHSSQWLCAVRGIQKRQLPWLSPCSLRLALTSVWSSYGHIPSIESPTEGMHLLCSENSLTSAKLKEDQVSLQKHFGIFLQGQTDSALPDWVTPLMVSKAHLQQEEQCPRASVLCVWDATLQCIFKQNAMELGLSENVGWGLCVFLINRERGCKLQSAHSWLAVACSL